MLSLPAREILVSMLALGQGLESAQTRYGHISASVTSSPFEIMPTPSTTLCKRHFVKLLPASTFWHCLHLQPLARRRLRPLFRQLRQFARHSLQSRQLGFRPTPSVQCQLHLRSPVVVLAAWFHASDERVGRQLRRGPRNTALRIVRCIAPAEDATGKMAIEWHCFVCNWNSLQRDQWRWLGWHRTGRQRRSWQWSRRWFLSRCHRQCTRRQTICCTRSRQRWSPADQPAVELLPPRRITFGNAGSNSLYNPSRFYFNMSLFKHFKAMRERLDVEFRAASFNIFNHTQFRITDPANPAIRATTLSTATAARRTHLRAPLGARQETRFCIRSMHTIRASFSSASRAVSNTRGVNAELQIYSRSIFLAPAGGRLPDPWPFVCRSHRMRRCRKDRRRFLKFHKSCRLLRARVTGVNGGDRGLLNVPQTYTLDDTKNLFYRSTFRSK